jgi:hypothetical protein
MENPHKIPIRKKRQISPQEEAKKQVFENDTNNLSLKDMKLEVEIENIQFPDEEKRLQETQQIVVEIAGQEDDFSEEESFTIENTLFDKNSRKLVFEGTNKRIKRGKPRSKYDLSKFPAFQIYKYTK